MYISSSFHHCLSVHLFSHHFYILSSLVNSYLVIHSKRSQFITLSTYLCVLFGVESLQPYPSSLMCRGLMFQLQISTTFFLWVAVSQFCYLGWSCLTPLSSTGILLNFLMVGELQLDQMSFDPLPSLPMNPLVEVTSREFPWTLSEWCSASMFRAISIVCFTLHPI